MPVVVRDVFQTRLAERLVSVFVIYILVDENNLVGEEHSFDGGRTEEIERRLDLMRIQVNGCIEKRSGELVDSLRGAASKLVGKIARVVVRNAGELGRAVRALCRSHTIFTPLRANNLRPLVI